MRKEVGKSTRFFGAMQVESLGTTEKKSLRQREEIKRFEGSKTGIIIGDGLNNTR